MDWFDIDDVLYEGTKTEMEKLRCPQCNGSFSYSYHNGRFVKKCPTCGEIHIESGAPTPNCVKYFGTEYTFA